MIAGGFVRPMARSASSMLLPVDHLPALLTNGWPGGRLPPGRGPMFRVGPPVWFSPRPPETSTAPSSTLLVSYVSDDPPPPLNAAATVMPLIVMRPSFVLPPCAVKNVMVGVAARPLL